MEILSPEDRVVLWRSVLDAEGTQRRSLLHAVAQDVFVNLSDLDLYGDDHKELTLDTFETLDDSGLFGRDSLRTGLERLHEIHDGVALLVVELASLLREAAGVDHLGAERRVRAMDMAGQWREHLTREPATPGSLSVAEVANRFGVSTQAVYKWLQKGRIAGEQGPGGSWRLPAAQFERDQRPSVDRREIDELQADLTRLHAASSLPSDEELGEQMRREQP